MFVDDRSHCLEFNHEHSCNQQVCVEIAQDSSILIVNHQRLRLLNLGTLFS